MPLRLFSSCFSSRKVPVPAVGSSRRGISWVRPFSVYTTTTTVTPTTTHGNLEKFLPFFILARRTTLYFFHRSKEKERKKSFPLLATSAVPRARARKREREREQGTVNWGFPLSWNGAQELKLHVVYFIPTARDCAGNKNAWLWKN